MMLTRDHLSRIVRFDVTTVVEVPDGVFREGDIVVLFNNTDKSTTIHSRVKESYHSGRGKLDMIEFPARSLVNLVFVTDETAVFTVGV
jgi:hypothetical protein